MKKLQATTLVLALLLPLAAQAGDTRDEVRQELAEARSEVHADLAKARTELETENLEVGNGFHFGKDGKRKPPHDEKLPKAEISPQGDFLIDGKAVAVNAVQRQQLLGYRGLIIDIAKDGIDAGEHAAMAAIEAADTSLFGLIVGGLTGSLERRVERTVKQHVEPMVRRICRRLPDVLASQQQLAASLPQFRPYATLEADDVEDCENDLRRDFAMH
ncbi:hypothetical protein GCM10027084_15890 [Pseudoxanthomonas sangjuensis]|uniref:hypothetical protein n=1 Tax=Pseudoxanthomonas sangjuensis TaxID=1503750 RepID=UPI001390B121|nr:hypothetical protein [Pseudoxanthomonas sangjuensis]KAF1707902.1 hypothetical protein CSC71_12330 [Pseudoxanthomonas sangjuensis]